MLLFWIWWTKQWNDWVKLHVRGLKSNVLGLIFPHSQTKNILVFGGLLYSTPLSDGWKSASSDCHEVSLILQKKRFPGGKTAGSTSSHVDLTHVSSNDSGFGSQSSNLSNVTQVESQSEQQPDVRPKVRSQQVNSEKFVFHLSTGNKCTLLPTCEQLAISRITCNDLNSTDN